MAVKKPLALYSGNIKELQAGDTISGATAVVSIKQVIIDYGAGRTSLVTPVSDPSIKDTSLVVASLAYDGPATSTPLVVVACGNVTSGSFNIFTRSTDGRTVTGVFRVNYISS